jgi:Ca-activated chloride channel family protein
MENPFLSPIQAPLSTFSVDVDTASYANIRRFLEHGQSVPPQAVRLEEMVNYFRYSYEKPAGEHPFTIGVESSACPWAPEKRLVKIGLKAKEVDLAKRPSANLVFLCDVSGSMNSPDKLPLLVENFKLLTEKLNADDTVSIVVYAGSEGMALAPTSGGNKQDILNALNRLSAGGSTNGGAGIRLAYKVAQERFLKGGINRVVLCTDGDFNVGTTGQQALVDLVKEKAQSGVFLSVCGYGTGNLNDSMMEAITNQGNGVYHYIDSAKEGRKVFQDELFGTLMTVAKDVKIQVEFNPAKVANYRLIGYDNRMLAKEDFANDKVDAGDVGMGHTVTALYEIEPVGVVKPNQVLEGLKYQQPAARPQNEPVTAENASPEMLSVKLRYKQPEGTESVLLEQPHTDTGADLVASSADFRFAAAVAEFGEYLRGKHHNGRSLQDIIRQADNARGEDPHGLRGEFLDLVRKAAGGLR